MTGADRTESGPTEAFRSEARERFLKVEALFEQLADEDTGDRRRRLDALEDEDSELARELEELLAIDGRSNALPTRGPWDDPLVEAAASDPALPEPGDRLGAYRIEAALGRGGMGRVFSARRDDGTFEGRVAIKLLDPSRRRASALRFCLERRILAGLDHPHIARLLDAGQSPGGVPYLVMEYVRGRPIDEYCDRLGAARNRRLELMLQLCSAVEHAHRRGLVHRDLKPANVLVTCGDAESAGRVKLLDFGIAKRVGGGPETDDGRVTGPGERWLSRSWASPEQASGGEVGYRSDVYTLGVLLDYLLDPARGGPGLDHDLRAIVSRATAKDPDGRYTSAEALADDLEAYREHRPVAARGGGRLYRALRFARRRGPLVAAVAAACLFLVGWAFQAVEQHRRLVAERDQAVEVARSLLGIFEQPLADRGIAGDLRAADLLDMGFRRAEPSLVKRPDPVRARVLGSFASAFRGLQQPDKALELADRALAATPEPDAHRAWLELERADALFDLGELESGVSAASAAWQWLSRRPGHDSLKIRALTTSGRGEILSSGIDGAEPFFRRAAALAESSPGHELELTDALLDLAWIRFEKGDAQGAQEHALRALEVRRAHLGEEHPELAVPLLHLGWLDLRQGRYRSAEDRFRRALGLRSSDLGRDHPLTLSTLHSLTIALERQGASRSPELLELLAELEQRQKVTLGSEHPALLETLARTAQVRRRIVPSTRR